MEYPIAVKSPKLYMSTIISSEKNKIMEDSPKLYGVPIALRKAKTLWITVPYCPLSWGYMVKQVLWKRPDLI